MTKNSHTTEDSAKNEECEHFDFDAVVMLTWSDWKKEPRSNRYHYATRFAKRCPVFFVQNTVAEGSLCEDTEIDNIKILHFGGLSSAQQCLLIDKYLRTARSRTPLIWVYSLYFNDIVRYLANNIIVYHATEAYFIQEGNLKVTADVSVLKTLFDSVSPNFDLLIAVSEGVRISYVKETSLSCPIITIENGCDFEFWMNSKAYDYQPRASRNPIAIYQGGINNRLDYELLIQLAIKMPEYDFLFCGRVTHSPDWQKLLQYENVKYCGELPIEEIAALCRAATVGLIPFVKEPLMEISMPLKAYEYVACGLPVVSTPINALFGRPDLFRIGKTSVEFVEHVLDVAQSRSKENFVRLRLQAAQAASYDERFRVLTAALGKISNAKRLCNPILNILVLYDANSTHVQTIWEHLGSFSKYSIHNIYYMSCTNVENIEFEQFSSQLDYSFYDAIVVHYCVRICFSGHINAVISRAIARFSGLKILFIQDEYDHTEIAREAMETFQFDIVYTCVPPEWIEYVYPSARFPKTKFLQTLTGYVPDSGILDQFVVPLPERPLHIAYRGRDLPHQYGALGREKYEIGYSMRRIADERDIPVDIEVSSSKRIYGDDWYRFLASSRATLGTESGSNIFDFDGAIAELARTLADQPYEVVYPEHFSRYEGPVIMNQISPKLFEAIRLRTALVLFEGNYSNVLRQDVHYIPLKKDYSNVDDVFRKLSNIAYLEGITKRAYDDIIDSGHYSYKSFISGFDSDIASLGIKQSRASIVSAPVLVLRRGAGDQPAFVPHSGALAYAISNSVLSAPENARLMAHARAMKEDIDELHKKLAELSNPKMSMFRNRRLMAAPRWMWRRLPEALRFRLVAMLLRIRS